MFCRFGSELESLPVAATVWFSVVWMRPSLRMSCGRASRYVFLIFARSR